MTHVVSPIHRSKLGKISKRLGLGSGFALAFYMTSAMPLAMLAMHFGISDKVTMAFVIMGPVWPIPLALAAIVTGKIALVRNKRDDDARTGRNAGCILIFLYALVISVFVAFAAFITSV